MITATRSQRLLLAAIAAGATLYSPGKPFACVYELTDITGRHTRVMPETVRACCRAGWLDRGRRRWQVTPAGLALIAVGESVSNFAAAVAEGRAA